MSTIIPADYADLLNDATPATLILTTLRRDGLLIAMDLSSLKARHIRNDPRVAAVILAPHEHNRYLHLHGQARARPDLDPQAVYCRIIWKYEHREPEEPTTLSLVEVVPTELRGFDYR